MEIIYAQKLQDLNFKNIILKRKMKLKFLGVMIDESLNWQSHIILVDTKFLKNIGLLFKGSLHLNKKCLLMVYFSFIHSHIILHGNTAWTSTSQTKLKKNTKQKHAVRIIFHGEKEDNVRPLLKEIHSLNVYQIPILQIFTFMQIVKNATIPRVFLNTSEKIEHKYLARFSKHNLKLTPAFINYAKFSISCWRPQI